MTSKYENVYVREVATITGSHEKKGPLYQYFDKSYDKANIHENTWEKAERRLMMESVDILLRKADINRNKIDLFIAGDLLNQIVTSNYSASSFGIPYLGIFSACAVSMEGIIIGSNFIESGICNNILCSTASHNASVEKQFRYPTEYGSPRPKRSSFTATGGASILLSNEKSNIKVESITIGKAIDMKIKDVSNMGAAMAPAAVDTIYNHLIKTNRQASYYDLILTGDLGAYGSKMFLEYMSLEHNIKLGDNYNDSALILYDREKQNVYAGGSGPVCLPLVAYSYVMEEMKKGNLKKVLLVATGALFSRTMANQKESIPCIAHAVSLEAVI